jgi:hypothetical protein
MARIVATQDTTEVIMRKLEDKKRRLTRELLAIVSLFALLISAPACMEGSEPAGAQVYYFSALERDAFVPAAIVDRGSNLPPEELAQLEPIFTSFDTNAEQLFKQADIDTRIESIENAYLSAGRYIELLGIYREDIKRQGLDKSPGATRLLWGLIRLGQEPQSKKLAVELVRARPQSADAWFLYGAYWIKYAAEDKDAAKRVVLGWSSAVDIDPRYRGFEGIDASTIRREVSRLRQESGVTAEQLGELQRDLLVAPNTEKAGLTPPPEAQAGDVVRTAQAIATAQGVPAQVEPEVPQQGADMGASVESDPSIAREPPVEQARQSEQTAEQGLLLALAEVSSKRAQGDEAAALVLLRAALTKSLPDGKIERASDVLKRDVDLFSLVRLAWGLDHDRSGAGRLFRQIAERPVSRSMTLYKYAMFAQNELEDRPLTRTLLEKLKAQDAEFAARYKVDALLGAL